MEPMKLFIGIARFPYGGNGATSAEAPEVGEWLVRTHLAIAKDDRCLKDVWLFKKADTPITMTRNRAVRDAKRAGVDVLVMVDSDMEPDLYLGLDPEAKSFWRSSFDFLYEHWSRGPCIIAAAYCGGPPHPVRGGAEIPFAFKWATDSNNADICSLSLDLFTREEVAHRAGFEKVAAAGTGLMMFDMRVFNMSRDPLPGQVSPPWFRYEYTDMYEAEKASTEDVYFTRDATMAGVPIYVNWDSWAGHKKPMTSGKPQIIPFEAVNLKYRQAVLRQQHQNDRLICLHPEESVLRLPADLVRGNGEAASGPPCELPDDLKALRIEVLKNPDGTLALAHRGDPGLRQLIAQMAHTIAEECDHPPEIVEVGTWVGETALALRAAVTHKDGKVHCIDHFQGNESDHLGGVVRSVGSDMVKEIFCRNTREFLGTDIILHEGPSVEMAKRFTDYSVDMVFIDADHTYQGCKSDIEVWLPKIRPGGLICGDDRTPAFPGVAQAVAECLGEVCAHERFWWKTVGSVTRLRGTDGVLMWADYPKADG